MVCIGIRNKKLIFIIYCNNYVKERFVINMMSAYEIRTKTFALLNLCKRVWDFFESSVLDSVWLKVYLILSKAMHLISAIKCTISGLAFD